MKSKHDHLVLINELFFYLVLIITNYKLLILLYFLVLKIRQRPPLYVSNTRRRALILYQIIDLQDHVKYDITVWKTVVKHNPSCHDIRIIKNGSKKQKS
jgi:hypothetical protein